ncbi:hypothetical protein [Paenibacillus tengchongensis]|uniref:hypothetical protein n=1 Tax=Paenibacillus tengchongensis TaxID=2608684 RepID=UPI00124F0281|nr:hypothetical protein [Paenibacillus tengchongensis]
MKKLLHIFMMAGLILLMITACSDDKLYYNYTFTGESESWSAEYIQKASEKPAKQDGKDAYYEPTQSYTFELKYKGDPGDLENIKQFKYGYKTTGTSTILTQDGPPAAGQLESKGNGEIILREDAVISVDVEWDGKSEQFELRIGE